MNPAVWARVMAACLVLPLGPLSARLVLGAAVSGLLSAIVPAHPYDTWALLGELALGGLLGVLVGLPVWAAHALRGESGPASLGFAGQVFSLATFFGLGGAALWIAGLAQTFVALPPAAWPPATQVIDASSTLFYGVLCLGLPSWLVALWVAPTAAWIDRVGRAGLGIGLATAARPVLTLVGLAALLPFLLDVVRELWSASLGAPLGG